MPGSWIMHNNEQRKRTSERASLSGEARSATRLAHFDRKPRASRENNADVSSGSFSNVGRVSTISQRSPALRFDRVIGDPLCLREREPRPYDLLAGAREIRGRSARRRKKNFDFA